MMLTRCPACQTTFRLHPEQLRARHGEVRCGHCLSAFNALEHLFEDPQALAKPAQQTPAAPPTPLPHTEIPLPPASSEHSSIESFDFDLSDDSQQQPDSHWPAATRRTRDVGGRDTPTHNVSPYDAPTHFPPSDPPARFPAFARGEEAPPTETPDISSASTFPPATHTPPRPPLVEFDPVIVPDDDELERLDATYGAPAPSRGRRIAWGLAVMLLTCTLAIQALYLFRQEIARELPGLRPLLVSACAQIGCSLPLPRDAGLIDIPNSDLQSEPGKAGRYVLYATVRNRANYPQTWPHLELTLTDTSDAPIARRVLDPQDWVTPEKLVAGFPARGDTAVRLAFDAPDLTPTSYRLYVFYP